MVAVGFNERARYKTQRVGVDGMCRSGADSRGSDLRSVVDMSEILSRERTRGLGRCVELFRALEGREPTGEEVAEMKQARLEIEFSKHFKQHCKGPQ